MAKKVKVYDAFVKGAKDGLLIVYHLAPTLIGLLVGTGVLRESGALDALANLLTPLWAIFNEPKAVIPLMVVKFLMVQYHLKWGSRLTVTLQLMVN